MEAQQAASRHNGTRRARRNIKKVVEAQSEDQLLLQDTTEKTLLKTQKLTK